MLRDVLACTERGGLSYEIRDALYRFYAFCAACSVPEIATLAHTICTWQEPMILAIQTGLSNARSEGYNRIVKHVGRIAFGFRTPENQRRRVRWACTRQSRRTPSWDQTAAPLLTRKSLESTGLVPKSPITAKETAGQGATPPEFRRTCPNSGPIPAQLPTPSMQSARRPPARQDQRIPRPANTSTAPRTCPPTRP